MKRVFRHILFSAAFFAGLMVLILLCTQVLTPKGNSREAGMEEVTMNAIFAEPENTIDVIIEGESVTYCGIIPLEIWRDLGVTAYVGGTPGQRMPYTEFLLKKIFKTQSPKYVMLDINGLFYDISLADEMKYNLYALTTLYRYHDRWKNLTWNDLFKEPEYTEKQRDKGYNISKAVLSANADNYGYRDDARRPIPERDVKHFERILALCRENGAELVLISVPSTTLWDIRCHNAAQDLADAYGLTLLDLNIAADDVGIDWNVETQDDGTHLNYWGALKATKYITAYLSTRENLTDHRNDPAYAPWNEALAEYDAYIKAEGMDVPPVPAA